MLDAFLRNCAVEELLASDYSPIAAMAPIAEALLALLRKGIRNRDPILVRKAGLLLLCHGIPESRTVRQGLSSLSAGGLLDELLDDAAGILVRGPRYVQARRRLVGVLDLLRPASRALDSLDDGCIHVLEPVGAGLPEGLTLVSPVVAVHDRTRSRAAQAGDLGLAGGLLVLADKGVNVDRIIRKLGECGPVSVDRIAAATDTTEAGNALSSRAAEAAWKMAANAARVLLRIADTIPGRPDWLADSGDAVRYALGHRLYDLHRRLLAAIGAIAACDRECVILAIRDASIGCAVMRWMLREGRGRRLILWIEDGEAVDELSRCVAPLRERDEGSDVRLADRVSDAYGMWTDRLPAFDVPAGDWYLLVIDLHSRRERYSIAGKALLRDAVHRAPVAVIQRRGAATEPGNNLLASALQGIDGRGRCILLADIGSPMPAGPSQIPRGLMAVADAESVGMEVTAGVGDAPDPMLYGDAVGAFVLDTLPRLFRDCRLVSALFSANPPRAAIACPVDSPEWRLVVRSARRSDVPTLGFANMFPSATPLRQPPPADYLAVRDRASGRYYSEQFGIGPGHIFIAGSPELDSLRRAVDDCRRAGPVSSQFRILIAPQPHFGDRFREIIACVAECTRGLDGVFTTVRPHPAESGADAETYRSACAAHFRDNTWMVDREEPWPAVLANSRVLVTLFSNAGLEAAAVGVDVIVMNLRRERLPIALGSLGIAAEACSRDDAMKLISSLAAGASRSVPGERLQANTFFAENPELLSPGAAGRIMDFIQARYARRTN